LIIANNRAGDGTAVMGRKRGGEKGGEIETGNKHMLEGVW